MKIELHNYDIYPKVVKTNKETKITVRPLGRHAEFSQGEYVVRVTPMNETARNIPGSKNIEYTAAPKNGILEFTHNFGGEGEYSIVFNGTEMRLYALEDDLFGCRPYMGDMHVHSCRSDGKESPAVVAANYRKGGFDFLAITDHGNFEPSLEAMEQYKEAPVDLCLLTGEEIHAPDNTSHYVQFGGSFSVNKIFNDDPKKYEKEVSEIEKTLDMPDNLKIYSREYASSLWIYQKIREAHGCSVMVHPHWIHGYAYHKPTELLIYELKQKPFDAFELIGGMAMYDDYRSVYENQMQVSVWQQVREDGCFVPPLGLSDSHGTANKDYEYFKLARTVVLSEKLEKDSIIQAIRENRSVALEQYKGERAPRCYGKHRYAAFVMFLITEYFPIHDDLCHEEGRLMKDYVCGDANAKTKLAALTGQTAQLLEKYWGG